MNNIQSNTSPSKNNSQKILLKFQNIGYTPQSFFTLKTTKLALDDISEASINSHFDPIIAEQLFYETYEREKLWRARQTTGPTGETNRYISIDGLIQSICQGLQILQEDYHRLIGELKDKNNHMKQGERKQILLELFTIHKNHNTLRKPFSLSPLQETQELYESLSLIPESIRNKDAYIFSLQPNQQTQGLKLTLWLAMFSLGLQLAMMIHKNHFYTLLSLSTVISIFFLNYFDGTYIKFVIINLLTSSFMDVIWEIVEAKRYWNGKNVLVSCHSHSSLLKLIIFCVVVVAVSKMMIAGLLFKYRNNPEKIVINLEFQGMRFRLDGDPGKNPVTKLISGF